MSDYTNTFMDQEAGDGAMIDPAAADAAAANSRLLSDIAEHDPSLISGPLRRDRQHWTRTGRHILSSKGSPTPPCEGRFIAPSLTLAQSNSVQPVDIGLYTSTATLTGYSLWMALLGPHASMLYPMPWYTWKLEVDTNIKVAEITGAIKWVEFVCAHARTSDGISYPDWNKIAQEYDAIHVTLPAVVAVQGFHFETPIGVIPPVFWDVETTFWLRWCFSEAHLAETVDTR
jgi:hypothetical protein